MGHISNLSAMRWYIWILVLSLALAAEDESLDSTDSPETTVEPTNPPETSPPASSQPPSPPQTTSKPTNPPNTTPEPTSPPQTSSKATSPSPTTPEPTNPPQTTPTATNATEATSPASTQATTEAPGDEDLKECRQNRKYNDLTPDQQTQLAVFRKFSHPCRVYCIVPYTSTWTQSDPDGKKCSDNKGLCLHGQCRPVDVVKDVLKCRAVLDTDDVEVKWNNGIFKRRPCQMTCKNKKTKEEKTVNREDGDHCQVSLFQPNGLCLNGDCLPDDEVKEIYQCREAFKTDDVEISETDGVTACQFKCKDKNTKDEVILNREDGLLCRRHIFFLPWPGVCDNGECK